MCVNLRVFVCVCVCVCVIHCPLRRVLEAHRAIYKNQQTLRTHAYESRNLESMVASCRASRDACARELAGLGDLVPGPNDAEREAIESQHKGAENATALIEHDVLSRNLTAERQARQEAVESLKEKRRILAEVRRRIGVTKKRMLERDEGFMKLVIVFNAEAKREQRAGISDPTSTRLWKPLENDEQRPLAKSLPETLYLVYYQLVSAKQTFDFEIDVAIHNGARDLLSKKVTSADSHLYETSDTYVSLSLREGKTRLVTVLFRYLPQLRVVVTETENAAQMTTLVGLYNDDTGEETPDWVRRDQIQMII